MSFPKLFGGIVYIAAVALATTHNVNLYAASADSEWARLFATAGALFVGANAIAMPLALHSWAVSGAHRYAAIALYAVDILVLALNAVVDNAVMTGAVLPQILQDYLIYAPATFILPLATWAVLWTLDPGERAAVMEKQAEQEFNLQVANVKAQWLQTPQGRAAAARQAAETLRFGEYGLNALNAPQQAALPVIDVPSVQQPAKVSRLAMLKAAMTGNAPAVFAQDVQQAQPPTTPAEPANPTPAA